MPTYVTHYSHGIPCEACFVRDLVSPTGTKGIVVTADTGSDLKSASIGMKAVVDSHCAPRSLCGTSLTTARSLREKMFAWLGQRKRWRLRRVRNISVSSQDHQIAQ